MKRSLICWLAAVAVLAGFDGHPGLASDYPASLETDVQRLLAAGSGDSSDPDVLIRVAGLYLDMGDDLYRESPKRLAAYEQGARFAKRAIEQQDANAEAHFLYAASLGSAAQLKGIMASAFTVGDLKAHVARALELKPDHAPALHMMGMMLEELPWFLGGDSVAALEHLKRAVTLDPTYAHARLDLARAYLKRRDREAGGRQLRALVQMTDVRDRYAWVHRYRPEAEQLLNALEQP